MKKLFPPNSLTTTYRREKNLQEVLSSFLFTAKFNKNESYISNCNKCDIFKNYLISKSDNKFKCKVTGRVTVLEMACHVTALMLFTLFLVRIVETSM